MISLLTHIGNVSDVGFSEWAKDAGVTPFEKALLIVVNLFTLHNIVTSFEGSGPLVGLSLVFCYFVFAFLSEWLGDRDDRFAPGSKRSKHIEAHNVWLRKLKSGEKAMLFNRFGRTPS